jgi:hypothetical protein
MNDCSAVRLQRNAQYARYASAAASETSMTWETAEGLSENCRFHFVVDKLKDVKGAEY